MLEFPPAHWLRENLCLHMSLAAKGLNAVMADQKTYFTRSFNRLRTVGSQEASHPGNGETQNKKSELTCAIFCQKNGDNTRGINAEGGNT